MDKTLYDLMDWAGIEEIVYSEAANPHRMLGAHMTPEGMLVPRSTGRREIQGFR